MKKLNNKIKSLKKSHRGQRRPTGKSQSARNVAVGQRLANQEYDDALTARIIEKITVRSRNEIEIRFIGGYKKDNTADIKKEGAYPIGDKASSIGYALFHFYRKEVVMKLGEKIKLVRKHRGPTQRELGERLHLMETQQIALPNMNQDSERPKRAEPKT